MFTDVFNILFVAKPHKTQGQNSFDSPGRLLVSGVMLFRFEYITMSS